MCSHQKLACQHVDAYSSNMTEIVPESLVIVAGRGVYPLALARSARSQGVGRICAIAFRGETNRTIESVCDSVTWIHLGQLSRMIEAIRETACRHAVMAGLITPTQLFRVRMDKALLKLLHGLKERNAHTIFGAIGDTIRSAGIEVLEASSFMELYMAPAGQLTDRGPGEEERQDIQLGIRIAKASSGLDIGQTVVIKRGTILAVEAFEGTDATIRRAGKLGGAGAVVVKVAKTGHDMRFDIPVIGPQTVKTLRRARIGAIALEAGRGIILEREVVVAGLNRLGIALVAVDLSNQGESVHAD